MYMKFKKGNLLINRKYEVLVFALVNGVFMSGIMSFIITFLNLGFIDEFITIWLNSYWKAFLVAFPIILIITPRIRKLVNKFFID